MNSTLLRAALGFVLVLVLLAYFVAAFRRQKVLPSALQICGAVCLMIVVLTHVAEALQVFPAMR
jgi:hypothetical protein